MKFIIFALLLAAVCLAFPGVQAGGVKTGGVKSCSDDVGLLEGLGISSSDGLLGGLIQGLLGGDDDCC